MRRQLVIRAGPVQRLGEMVDPHKPGGPEHVPVQFLLTPAAVESLLAVHVYLGGVTVDGPHGHGSAGHPLHPATGHVVRLRGGG